MKMITNMRNWKPCLKCNEIQKVKPRLSKLGLSYRWDSDVVMHSNKQSGP